MCISTVCEIISTTWNVWKNNITASSSKSCTCMFDVVFLQHTCGTERSAALKRTAFARRQKKHYVILSVSNSPTELHLLKHSASTAELNYVILSVSNSTTENQIPKEPIKIGCPSSASTATCRGACVRMPRLRSHVCLSWTIHN